MIMCLIAHLPLIMAWLSQVREAGDDANEEEDDCGCSAVGLSGSSSSSSSPNATISEMSLVFRVNFMPAVLADSLAMATVVLPPQLFSPLLQPPADQGAWSFLWSL